MELPVCREEQRVGSLRLREQGGWAELVMTCQPDSTGLFRGFLACDGGELPLGVLSPEGGRPAGFPSRSFGHWERRGEASAGSAIPSAGRTGSR